MTMPRLSEIEEQLAQPQDGLTAFPCAVLRNVTIEGLEPYLRYTARRDGLDLQCEWGEFDNILQEASGGGRGVISTDTHAVLVCLWLPAFSELFGAAFPRANVAQLRDEMERVGTYCAMVIRALRERTKAPILWMGFESPAWPSYGIADVGMPVGHRAAIDELNRMVSSELLVAGNAFLVDTSLCSARVGAAQFYDWRYWYMARSPYSRSALAELATEIAKYVRALAGRARKCLVLDCDNTMWGGIVGEDGLDGIKIGVEHPGAAFRDFQQEILNLYHRGVILAICSKNNEQDVAEVFRSRPEMVLREEHFAVMRVNWRDKAANLREIASEIGIGLDSLVFIDDSEFEVNLVRSALPEVETLLFPAARASENHSRLASCGLFDTLSVTDEDRARGQMYRAEVARKALRVTATDMGEYLRSLEMRLTIQEIAEGDLDRAAQLCQRTNQFNLTTRRYARDDLALLASTPGTILRQMRLADRFGEYGVIGLAIMKVNEGNGVFDTFLMSCRALGRGVETAFLTVCADAMAKQGARTIRGCYIPTKKNAQVSEFFAQHGFDRVGDDGSARWFQREWRRGDLELSQHLAISNLAPDGDLTEDANG